MKDMNQKKKAPQKVLKEGDLCKKCLTPVIKKTTSYKSIKRNKAYHFETLEKVDKNMEEY